MPEITEHKLIMQVTHEDFKAFMKAQLKQKGFYKTAYTITLMVTGFLFFAAVGYAISVFAIAQEVAPLLQLATGLIFCFSLLIVLHELLHALAYKVVGAKKVYFGAMLSKFVFFAGSDQEKFNGTKYRFIALFPFLSITCAGLLLILFFPEYFLFSLTILFFHTLFCGGDFAVLNFIGKYDLRKFYTYDSRQTRETYFYLES